MSTSARTLVLSALLLSVAAPAFADGPGEDYYRQFTYLKETSNDGDGGIKTQYRELLGQSEVTVSPLKKIMVTASLYLLDGQTYVATYSEMFGLRDTPTSEWHYIPNMDSGSMCPKVLKGSWSAPVDRMILTTSALSGDRATFDSRPAVKLIFNDKIMSPEVKGTELVMDYGYSMDPIEISVGRGGFCPY